MSRINPVPSWAARLATLSLVATTATAAAVGGSAGSAQGADAAPQPSAQPVPHSGSAPADPEVDMQTLRVPPAAARAARRTTARAAGEAAHTHGTVVAKLGTTRSDDFGLVGVTWPADQDAPGLHVEVRTHDTHGWSDWDEIPVEEVDTRDEPGARAGTLPAWVGDADGIAVRMLADGGATPAGVRVALIDGGTGLAEEPEGTTLPRNQAGRAAPMLALGAAAEGSGIVEQPDIVLRSEWGVDTSTEVPCDTPRTASTMRGIVLHHTAGSNDYTAAEAPGIVRGIHRYHTVSRGWCDIGYNFLVDKYGTVYEGRRGGITKQVRGAHAGDWLVNKWTTGISMMGNFENVPVPAALKDGVVQLSAWRLWLFGRQAEDTMLIDDVPYQRLSGHRDFKSTACPGKYGYEWLNNGMRQEVQAVLDAAGPSPTEPTPTEPTPTEPEPTPTTPPPDPVVRYAGDSRYATAASITEEAFPDPVGAVFLASGTDFPDALSGGPAASLLDVPVLLVRPNELPAETAEQLDRLQPSQVFVLGGDSAVSETVLQQVRQQVPTVTRLFGSNRYKTGVAIVEQFWTGASTVYLASGESYPDALSGGALAARTSAPILLSDSRSLPAAVAEELSKLAPSSVVLLGGPGALGQRVWEQVTDLLPGASVQRIGGADRFATSAAIAEHGWTVTSERAYLAAGSNFPDALAGVPAAARSTAPLLLSRRDCLPAPVRDELTRLSPDQQVLLGGASVLSESALDNTCGS